LSGLGLSCCGSIDDGGPLGRSIQRVIATRQQIFTGAT
jgi:hypothetical protein